MKKWELMANVLDGMHLTRVSLALNSKSTIMLGLEREGIKNISVRGTFDHRKW